jgi:hypothetical protein
VGVHSKDVPTTSAACRDQSQTNGTEIVSGFGAMAYMQRSINNSAAFHQSRPEKAQ